MKYYIIAGEASGDMHGANLIKYIHILDQDANIRFWGGDKMLNEGGTIVMNYKNTAFMGFVEVVKNLRVILKLITFCKHDILDYKPDALILIDYPGFNLRIAEWAKKQKLTVYYYISPTVWAWKASRVNIIRRSVRKMFTILPFEKEFYKKYNYDVEYCGHPLLDAIEQYKHTHRSIDPLNKSNVLLLLPGSRKQEIENMLPTMLQATANIKDVKIVIAGVSTLNEELYLKYTQGYDVEIKFNQTYDLLMQAHAAIVTSGTASLETALFNVPQMIVYKANALSIMIARYLVNIKYIGLPNLILNKLVVKEFIQEAFNIKNIEAELSMLWNDETYRQSIFDNYSIIREVLGTSGASACVAEKIYTDMLYLNKNV